MARRTKKVDEVFHHRRGLHVSVFLDLESGGFTANVLDELVQGKTLPEIKDLVQTKLGAFDQYRWEPVIQVESDVSGSRSSYYGSGGARREGVGLTIAFWRVEIAQNPQSPTHFVERPFLVDGCSDEDRARDSGDDLADCKERNEKSRAIGRDVHTHASRDAKRIPYSDAAWATLHLIRERIEQAGKQLEELLARDDLAKRLEAIGPRFKLLPPMFLDKKGG